MRKLNPTKPIIYLFILLFCFLLALFMDSTPNQNLNGFWSYMLLGLWLCISFVFVSRIKDKREFNTSFNRFGMIFGSLLMGIFYTFWGDYSTILNSSLLGPNVSFNAWHLLFGLPYLIFGGILLFFCIKKYFFIYIGSKTTNSRIAAIIFAGTFIFIDLVYFLIQGDAIQASFLGLTPENTRVNLLLLFNLFQMVTILLLAILNKRRMVPRISASRASSRINSIDRQLENVDRYARSARQRELEAQQRTRVNDRRQAQLGREREQERKRQRERDKKRAQKASANKRQSQSRSSSTQRSKSRAQAKPKSKPKSKTDLKRLYLQCRPKAGTLSADDFKCIFCFDLPSTSDGHHGVVVCPKCKYPAHVDEFKSWIKTSALCSRCDGLIPISFRKNPRIISTADYLKAYKYWKKKF